ncbi:MAG: hypothetical protein PF692_14655 [Kiritimatiellae bacterium]|nr:hypothetical protein [Kiritimatiellia bacterium]
MKYTALIAMFLLLVLRAFLKPLFHGGVSIGFLEWNLSVNSIPIAVAFSFVVFIKFLIPFFALATLYVHDTEEKCTSEETVFFILAKPFSFLTRNTRPIVLFVFVFVLLVVMNFISPLYESANGYMQNKVGFNVVLMLISTLYELIGVLSMLYNFCIVLIIFSWISLFTGSPNLAAFSRSWLYFIMGPLKNVHLQIGPFDLTPLLFIFGLQILHRLLANLLLSSFMHMLG